MLGLWPTAVSYVVSYVFVAIIWINHHYLMAFIEAPSLRMIWLNFGHLFFVSLLPFATAWMARTELGHVPVLVYASLFVVTDGMYNLFEREILGDSTEVSAADVAAARRRSRLAFGFFVLAALLALVAGWVGLVAICLALALHLRPDATSWQHRASDRTRRGRG